MVFAEYAVVLAVIAVLWYVYKRYARIQEMPPGPWGFPFIGYLPYMNNKKKLREHLDGLAKQYGDVFSFRIGEHYVIGLQSHDAISEAYAIDQLNARPETLGMQVERMTGMAALFFGDERDRWSDYRKMATRVIGAWTKPHGREYLDDLLEATSSHFMEILEEGQGEPLDTMMSALSVVFPFYEVVTYGGKYDKNSDMIQAINKFFEESSDVACNEFNLWIDHMPLLQKMKSNVAKDYYEVANVFVNIIKPSPALVRRFGMVQEFEKLVASGQSFAEGLRIENLLSGVFLTAIDLATSISWMFAILAKNQDVTQKLRRLLQQTGDEADRAGRGRLQAIENEPYVKAVVYEIIRYSSECFGIPRCAIEDLYFRGYLIPKGSLVIGNTTAGNNDPLIFPEPEKFRPERFIADDGSCDPALQAKVLTYSIGKRRCLGEALTTAILSAIVGKIVQKYDWDFASGEENAISTPTVNGYSRAPGEHTIVLKPLEA